MSRLARTMACYGQGRDGPVQVSRAFGLKSVYLAGVSVLITLNLK